MAENTYSYFLRRVVVLGLPLVLQSLLFSSAGFLDNLMVSQLGTQEVAASSIGARVFWFVGIFIWGMGTGMGVLLAQYWGAKDEQAIAVTLHLVLLFLRLLQRSFSFVCGFFPLLFQLCSTRKEEQRS